MLTSKKPINKLFAGTYALFSLRLRGLNNATSAGACASTSVNANGGAEVAWRHHEGTLAHHEVAACCVAGAADRAQRQSLLSLRQALLQVRALQQTLDLP